MVFCHSQPIIPIITGNRMSRIHSTASTVSGLSLLLLALLTHPPPTPSLSHRPLHVTTHLSGPGLPPPPSRACLPLRWGPPARRRVSGDVLQGLSLQSCGREGQKQGFRLLTEPRHNTKLQHHFCKEGSRSRNQDLPVGTTAVSAT